MTARKSDHRYGVEMYGFPDFVLQHVPTKKAHYDAWSSTTGSSSGCSSSCSPNHLEELHVDIPHSSTASVASNSTPSHSSPENAAEPVRPLPSFTELKPISPNSGQSSISNALAQASEVLANGTPGTEMPTTYTSISQSSYQPVTVPAGDGIVVPLAPKPIYPNAPTSTQCSSHPVITHDARFSSYAEFDEAFEAWKRECLHPFRVASSETLREPDGTVNHRFKYRYVVFHCAHYGEPRMRGIGKRPNQHYLPSGCRAMLRLNYSFSEQLLKITTLNDEHLNHEVSAEMFKKVSAKLKRSSCSASSPACKRVKYDSPADSPMSSPATTQASPLTANSQMSSSMATSAANHLATQISMSQPNTMADVAIALQQQQIMASILSQQKENINLAAGLTSLAMPRPQPSMLNILSMMGLQQRMLLQQQPAYGLVAPLTQQVTTPPQAQSVASLETKSRVGDSERQKNNIATPVAVKPGASSAVTTEMSPNNSPPHLVAEAPAPELTSNAASASPLVSNNAAFEESLARLRSGSQDSEFLARMAQLNSLSSFWGTSSISEYR